MDGLKARLSFDAVAYDYDDEYLTIDTDTHIININNVSRLFGVQYDGNSKLIKFRISNKLSDIQKMQDSIVYINWIDSKGVKGQSIAIDKTINNDTCEFAWKVPFDALKNSGVLHFAMSAVVTKNSSSVIDQRWSTQIASVTTPDGIYIKSYTPSSEEEDRIAQIYNELSNMINKQSENLQSQVNSLNEAFVNLNLIATEQDFVLTNGKYINAGSLNINEAPNYAYTNPYLLKKGNKLVISTKGAGSQLSVLALCDLNNEIRINLIPSIDSNKHEYSYISSVDMYITMSITTDDYSIRVYKPNINDSITSEKSILAYNSPIQIEKIKQMIYNNSYTKHDYYCCSKPIKMMKGQKIEINIRCESAVSAISKVQEDGTILQSVLMGKGIEYLRYEYIADEDCYVTVCFYVNSDFNNQFDGITYYPTYKNLERIYNNSVDRMSFSMFENFGVIGDSFASGVFFDKTENKLDNNLNKSWGQILARKSGNICTNFSKGGLYCGNWLTDTDRGLPYLLQESAKELYIIALGINDVSRLSGEQPLGTIADINTDFSQNPNSFYGNYGRIIGNIKQHAPNSKIIITTIPYTGEGAMQINNAIVDIANHYELPCLKLHTNAFFQSSYFWNNMYDNHPKSFMYGAMSNEYEIMICNDIKVNTSYWGDTFN